MRSISDRVFGSSNPYSRSLYIPGGKDRNCNDRGISPKSHRRRLAELEARKKRKGVKNPKMK